MITGFRLGPAGAQGRFDLTPDLSIFGKVIGGGLPLAAVGGPGRRHGPPRARSATCTRPARSPGTRSRPRPGSPRSPQLDADDYATLEARVATVRRRARAARSRDAGLAGAGAARRHARRAVLRARAGARLRGCAGRRPRDLRAVLPRACSTRGVFLAPSGYEVMFVSLAHTDADLDRTVELAAEAAREIA